MEQYVRIYSLKIKLFTPNHTYLHLVLYYYKQRTVTSITLKISQLKGEHSWLWKNFHFSQPISRGEMDYSDYTEALWDKIERFEEELQS